MTGLANTDLTETSTPKAARMRETSWTASSESPPISKKLSSEPMGAMPSNSLQIEAKVISACPTGATWSVARWAGRGCISRAELALPNWGPRDPASSASKRGRSFKDEVQTSVRTASLAPRRRSSTAAPCTALMPTCVGRARFAAMPVSRQVSQFTEVTTQPGVRPASVASAS